MKNPINVILIENTILMFIRHWIHSKRSVEYVKNCIKLEPEPKQDITIRYLKGKGRDTEYKTAQNYS